ncbi:diacylglycerol kinase family protein [Pseudoduganella danionis]|uniref:diacylglycerol/lipid kinase family protein n=1 Tax=Pseudoduganella danionis TaxID=1890295 RepID=UPI0035AE8A2E
MKLEPLVVLINAGAGTGSDAGRVAALVQHFRQHGCEAEVVLARSGAELIERARQAVVDGVTTVVAGGGDGSINAVASALVGSSTRLGVLPLGTLNHFAKDMHIPLELEHAIANVVHGQVVTVDVGEVNGRIFLNNSSLGIYPDIVRDREQQQRRFGRSKWPAFGRAVFAALRRFPFLSLELTIDGVQHTRRTPFIFIGNNEYQQGLSTGRRSRLDSGRLCLYVAQRPTRLALLGYALHLLFGQLAQARDFDVLQTAALSIATRRRHLRVATDGEVTRMKPPLLYRSLPAALQVIVPR